MRESLEKTKASESSHFYGENVCLPGEFGVENKAKKLTGRAIIERGTIQ